MWETELYIMTDAYQDMRQLANFLLKKSIDSGGGKENKESRIEQNSNNNKTCDKTPNLAKELKKQQWSIMQMIGKGNGEMESKVDTDANQSLIN